MSGNTERRSRHPALADWFLDDVLELDVMSPGLAGHVFRASNERRQVIGAALAGMGQARSERGDSIIARAFQSAGHEEILAIGYPVVPSGFRSALRRTAPAPHSRAYYMRLHQLLDGGATDDIRVVRRLHNITALQLDIMESLPHDLRVPAAITALRSVKQASDLARFVDLASGRGVDRAAMIARLTAVTGDRCIRRFVERWSRQLRLPPHPVPATVGYRPLEHAQDLHAVGLSHRNCLRTYVATALESRASFAEVTTATAKGVAHLTRISGDWVLHHVWGPDNDAPNPDVETLAREHLHRHGVLPRSAWKTQASEWEALRRLTGVYDFAEDVEAD